MTDSASMKRPHGPRAGHAGQASVHARHPAPAISYRPDIDGLRAISIVGVLLFHASVFQPAFRPFVGGFVGVDVFFVISGYLITSIILREIAQGRFTLASFYERRIRRIFPALFSMLIVTTLAASLLMLPKEIRTYGGTLMAAAGFVTNFVLALGDGYFVTTFTSRPLLHLWSLAIEEQFYIVFPFLMILTARFLRGRFAVMIGVLTVAFFALGWWLVFQGPASFFWTQARAWEILIGAVLASGAVPRLHNRRIREALGWLGLAMILYAMATFTEGGPWPGPLGLVPCVGAALVIYAGEDGPTGVGRLLSLKPLVVVGLLSYSLYVWHWPILAITQSYYLNRPLSVLDTCLLLGVAVVVSVVSRRYIERPFLGRSGILTRRQVFGCAVAVAVATALFGAMLIRTDGWPQRLPKDVADMARISKEGRGSPCVRNVPDGMAEAPCLIGAVGKGEPSFALWGDSHADAILAAVSDVAVRNGREGVAMIMRGCGPLVDGPILPPFAGVPEGFEQFCAPFNTEAYRIIVSDPRIKTVIVAARWSIYASLMGYGDADDQNVAPFIEQPWFAKDVAKAREQFVASLTATMLGLHQAGKTVYVLMPIPEVRVDVPQSMARSLLLGRPFHIRSHREDYDRRNAFARDALEKLAANGIVKLLDPATVFCPSERCVVQDNGHPFYFDDDHLSRLGAAQLEPMFDEAFKATAPTTP